MSMTKIYRGVKKSRKRKILLSKRNYSQYSLLVEKAKQTLFCTCFAHVLHMYKHPYSLTALISPSNNKSLNSFKSAAYISQSLKYKHINKIG